VATTSLNNCVTGLHHATHYDEAALPPHCKKTDSVAQTDGAVSSKSWPEATSQTHKKTISLRRY
jgi:hypothetical protein